MKATIICSLFLCSAWYMSSATANTILKDSIKENAITYFTKYISGTATPYKTEIPIEISELSTYRQLVWKAWKEANLNLKEEKLPPLDDLSKGTKNSWKLPENLEPHAIMPYYWGQKGESIPEKGLPLYLYLHGSGPKRSEWATGLKICQKFDDAPSAYFIPQIPNEQGYYRWWQKAKQYAWEKLLRLALISEEINPDRIYIFGISEGGYGSQRLASFYADYLAGAGPMAGGEPLKNAPAENCSNIAFSLRTGEQDNGFYRNQLTTYVKEEFGQLQYSHPEYYNHKIELIPGMGHHIDYNITTPWLKQHTRNPYPKYFYWEDFEMDGIHRKGFYNLFVNKSPDEEKQSRTCYEMRIIGNNISLTISNVTYEIIQKDPKWGIEMKFNKHYTPASKGKITVYLCEELINLNKKVTLTVNGEKVFKGKVKPNINNMINSCAIFFDPQRIYPAAIEVEF